MQLQADLNRLLTVCHNADCEFTGAAALAGINSTNPTYTAEQAGFDPAQLCRPFVHVVSFESASDVQRMSSSSKC